MNEKTGTDWLRHWAKANDAARSRRNAAENARIVGARISCVSRANEKIIAIYLDNSLVIEAEDSEGRGAILNIVDASEA